VRVAIACILVMAKFAAAHADSTGGSASPPSPPGLVPAGSAATSDAREPGLALVLSIGVTTLGGGILASSLRSGSTGGTIVGMLALLVGPSTGRWYAGDAGLVTLGLRAASGVAIVEAIAISADDDDEDCLGSTPAQCTALENQIARDNRHSDELLLSSAAVWLGTSVYDVVVAYTATKRWNAVHVVPLATSSGSTGRVAGLALSGAF
jgi:hypothetical protein